MVSCELSPLKCTDCDDLNLEQNPKGTYGKEEDGEEEQQEL